MKAFIVALAASFVFFVLACIIPADAAKKLPPISEPTCVVWCMAEGGTYPECRIYCAGKR